MQLRRPYRLVALVACAAMLAGACGDSDDTAAGGTTTATSAAGATAATGEATATSVGAGTPAAAGAGGYAVPPSSAGGTTGSTAAGAGGQAGSLAEVDPQRCQANRDAGTITFPTAFSYAAAVSILDPVVADAQGFFSDVCLDVDIIPSFAGQAAAAMASGQAQIGEIGSFGEMVTLNLRSDTDFVAVAQYGKTAVQALVVPAEAGVTDLAELQGRTIGIKTDLPSPVQVMLARAGVERGQFDELLLEGFDPIAHLELGIDALPVYKSNEPMTLDAAGVAYELFDPLDFDVPASFGVVYTTVGFLSEHPTVVEDFVRAAFRGFQFAVENPTEAVAAAVELINTPESNFASTQEAEEFRWITESGIVVDSTPPGQGVGIIDPELASREVQSLVDVGLLDELPDLGPMMDVDLAAGLYDGDQLLWPGSGPGS